nr:RNA-directed DNA polymerase, eukaryota, reverse transcriptase zinc-binding domain protein [Tanacetum cinerariifolium]
ETNGLIRLKKKFQALKIAIKAWSKKLTKGQRNINIQQNLSEVDKLIDQGKSNDEILIKRITLLNDLQELNNMNAIEIFQKAKIRWSIEDQVQDLERIVTYEEVKRVVWDCGANKSPEPDGFSFEFYLFIGEWNNNNIQTLLSVLRWFYLASGLEINLHKSKLMGIGVNSNVVAAVASLIGCSILTAPFNYLGVKVGSYMSKITSWDDVISKVSLRLSKWKLKLLFIGGRLSLLKLVLTLIPLYHMSIFKVPIGVLNHLESIYQNFFYGVDGSDRKLAWIGWDMVLTSKKNGGLGVSSFFAHNRALLFKWVWRFLTDGSSLWTRFIKAIFGNKRALDTNKLIPKRSPWQDVILAIYSLQSKCINLMDFIQKKLATENYGLLCSKVVDLVLPNISDRWCWSLEGSQEFSVKSSRILIDNTIFPKSEFPTRWFRVIPIKVNVHVWRVFLDKLHTRANLSLRGIDIPSIACPL